MYIKVDYQRKGVDRLSNTKHQKYNHIEFIQTMCDNGNVLAGSHILPMRYGAVFIIDSSMPHCTAPKDANNYVRNCMTVDKPSFDRFINAVSANDILYDLYRDGVYFAVPDKDNIEKVKGIFKEFDRLRQAAAPETDYYYQMLKLMLLLRDSSVVSGNYSEDRTTVGKALAYLDRNLALGVSTQETAEALHINKHYLCHVFKKKTGMTLSEYLLDKRLMLANQLLSDHSLSIFDVSVRVGFSSESYFISKYKQRYGIPPGKKRALEAKDIATAKGTDNDEL